MTERLEHIKSALDRVAAYYRRLMNGRQWVYARLHQTVSSTN